MAIFDSEQRAAIIQMFDAALDELSKPCKLWYPSVLVDCTNCLTPVSSEFFNNTGLHGGPIVNTCVYCGGSNKIQQEVTDTINLEIDWSPKLNRKEYVNMGPKVKLPYDLVIVKGYFTDLPKLYRATEIQLATHLMPVLNNRYIVANGTADPYNVIQGRYFTAVLERVA